MNNVITEDVKEMFKGDFTFGREYVAYGRTQDRDAPAFCRHTSVHNSRGDSPGVHETHSAKITSVMAQRGLKHGALVWDFVLQSVLHM